MNNRVFIKFMRTNLLLAMMLCVCAIGTSMAQMGDTLVHATQAQKSEAIALRMQHELSLTNAQQKQIAKLMKDRLASLEKLGPGRQSFEAINEKFRISLTSILTGEQSILYQNLRKEKAKVTMQFLQEHPNYTFSNEDIELDF